MNHITPDSIATRSLERACELLALRMVTEGTDSEINEFASNLHKRLDNAIDRVLRRMEANFRINESINNPKIA